MLNNLAQSISSKLTWLQKKELIEDGDDNAVSGRHTPAIPAAEHHCCQPQCTKLNTSKAILLKSREREVSDLYLAVARPTSSTICHPDPQQPPASHLPLKSPPSLPASTKDISTSAISDFSTLLRAERKNCSSCSRRIPPLLLRPSRAHYGCYCL